MVETKKQRAGSHYLYSGEGVDRIFCDLRQCNIVTVHVDFSAHQVGVLPYNSKAPSQNNTNFMACLWKVTARDRGGVEGGAQRQT